MSDDTSSTDGDTLATIHARGHLKDCLLVGPEYAEWATTIRRKMERTKGWRVQTVHVLPELEGEGAIYYVPLIGDITRIAIQDNYFDADDKGDPNGQTTN